METTTECTFVPAGAMGMTETYFALCIPWTFSTDQIVIAGFTSLFTPYRTSQTLLKLIFFPAVCNAPIPEKKNASCMQARLNSP